MSISGNSRNLRSKNAVVQNARQSHDDLEHDTPVDDVTADMAEPDNGQSDDDPTILAASEPDEPPSRRYSTRPSNNPHPALAAGLAKRSQADIRKEAQRKRDEKEAEWKRKEAAGEKRQLELEQKLQKLAALEQELRTRRAVEMAELVSSRRDVPEPGEDESEVVIVDSDRDVPEGMIATCNTSDEENTMNLTAKEINEDEGRGRLESDDALASEDSDVDVDDGILSGQKRKAKKPPAKPPKPKARKKLTQKEKRQEFLREAENAKGVQRAVAGESTSRQNRASELEASARKAKSKQPPLTAKQPAKPKLQPKSGAAKKSGPSAPKSKAPALSLNLPTMGLKADWKAVVARRFSTPEPSAQRLSSSAAGSSGQAATPTPRLGGAAHRTANVKRSRRQDSLENIGGFTDADVTVGIGSLSSSVVQHRHSGQMVRVVGGVNTEEGDGHSGTATTKKRRAKTVVSDEKSLAVQSLPSFAEHHWKSTFVPTMLQMLRQTERPWVYASGKTPAEDNLLIDIVQGLVDAFWPEEQYHVNGSDKIYRIARQAVVDWRARFVSRTKSFVKKSLEKQGSSEQIAIFVKGALVRSNGAAFWERCDAENGCGVGALKSRYVLKSFATHLAAIEGSQLKENDVKPARGALALAATAHTVVHCSHQDLTDSDIWH
ncbi:uncharacterized protein C8Q71DRAFT_721618 [Rhodofomes roseus]|uniref:Uncharacterized protein n=1 Tax=Rhodofomes roseus TaxID=34475 RepID=A0ABQ8KN00_9APHY|nr:uncharacterized protein C8Q71DRAFT_721618 [Rhodofomes roseus]KAH9839787.1 hypothetical protein C8Q71DRAFT_721618 [Rhodofomes roseus]